MEPSNTNQIPGSSNLDATDSVMQQSLTPLYWGAGWTVFSAESFFQQRARDKTGEWHKARIHIFQDWNTLMPWQRNELFKLQPNLFALISSRARTIGSTPWMVVPARKIEDEVAERLKVYKFLWDQLEPDLYDLVGIWKKEQLFNEINKYLGAMGLKPDLSNFDGCLRYWARVIRNNTNESAAQIEDWCQAAHKFTRVDEDGNIVPSTTQGMQDILIQGTTDQMVHGNMAIQPPTELFDGITVLPGGSVFRVPGVRVGMPEFYVQLMYGAHGYGYQEPVWFFPDEISLSYYMPSSNFINGMRPLDAIMLHVSSIMSYDQLVSKYSNNEVPVEKILVVVDEQPNLTPPGMGMAPTNDIIDGERTEEIMNSWQKDRNVRVKHEKGKDVKLIDLSRSDIMALLRENNHEDFDKLIARVYNATPNEMNETGPDGGTLAKAGTEAFQQIYNQQGLKPMYKSWEHVLTHEVFPKKFGHQSGLDDRAIMWEFKFGTTESDSEKYAKAKEAIESQSMSKNEIREIILGLDRTSNEADDQLTSGSPQPQNSDIMSAIQNRR